MRSWRGATTLTLTLTWTLTLCLRDFNITVTRLLLSVLPQHVAVEMKGDIMSPVEVPLKLENTPIGDNFSCRDTESVKNVNDNGMWGNDRVLMQGQFHKIYIQRHENVR